MRVYRNCEISMNMIKSDIRLSRLSLDEFYSSNCKSYKGASAYHIQQACEKLIKYKYIP